MKLNLSGLQFGLIGLEKKVIDLSKFKVRSRATEQDLQRYYSEFIERTEVIRNYFENQDSFDKAKEEIVSEKKPELIARDSVYPGFFNFLYWLKTPVYRDPNKKIKEEKYFFNARCMISIPLTQENHYKGLIDNDNPNIFKSSDRKIKAKIEIPNDQIPAKIKLSTFHESLHYFLTNYLINSGKLFTDRLIDKSMEISKKEKLFMEHLAEEAIVEKLNDILLENDKDALFEKRWLDYSVKEPVNYNFFRTALTLGIALPTGFLIGKGISNPEFLPLTLVPIAIGTFIHNNYKSSKRKYLLQSKERKEFKI